MMTTSRLYYVPAFEGRKRDGSWGAAVIQLGDSCYNPFTGQTVPFTEVERLWEEGWITKLDSPVPIMGGAEPPKAIVLLLESWAVPPLLGDNPPNLLGHIECDGLETFVFDDAGFAAFARARADALGKELLKDPAKYGVSQYEPLLRCAENLAHNSPYILAAKYRCFAPASEGRGYVVNIAKICLTPEDFNVFTAQIGVEGELNP